ncbi:MAG: TlpA family protein disulfide reductase [Comamonadaceae bacterium]|nr:TlpA family protein disulfide reductase [Comamonadaceae bacterium]
MPFPLAPDATYKRRHFMLMTLLAASAKGPLLAATPNAQVAPELEGTAPDGQHLRLAGLRGRVVLVFYWATGCAVCRDKMRELRANLTGWKGQPFTLLGVNMDARQQDFIGYENLVRQTVPTAQQFSSLWAGAAGFRDSMGRPELLPSACLIDKQGRLVERYNGRIPPEAWDRIAELL